MFPAQVSYTLEASPHALVDDLRKKWTTPPGLIVWFASPAQDSEVLATQLKRAFPTVPQLGCTTAGEIAGSAMLKGSVVALSLPREMVGDVAVALVPDLRDVAGGVAAAMASFASHFGKPVQDMDPRDYVGLVLMDGLSLAEEEVLDALGNHTDVPFVGGSAGDDLQFKQTRVFANGQVRTNAAVLALLKPVVAHDVVKTQSFAATSTTLVATRVDEARRTVHEFNGLPAVEAYARAVGLPVDKVDTGFMKHPVGLMVNGAPYVRSPQRVQGDALHFYCNIRKGMELVVLEGRDMVEDTRHAVAAKAAGLGGIAAILNFHCILRTLQLEADGRCQAYGEVFGAWPTVGFSTYGEAYLGHINQTSTMLLLGNTRR